MKPNYEDNLDKNFERAITLCESNYSREELFVFLKNGNMPEKQFAALEIDTVLNCHEADILIDNLTGCDGKIREAVSYKISEIISEKKDLFLSYPEIFADATIDINANICRTIIECLAYLKNSSNFADKYLNKIFLIINEALDKFDSFIFRDKKYTINKQLFKIYWCLEGINVFYKYINEDKLYNVLDRCAHIEEYTIREKVALVLKNKFNSPKLLELRNNLKFDENYYVKNV